MSASNNPFLDLFNSQKSNQFNIGNTTAKQRIKKLKALQTAVEKTYKTQIQQALYNDFKKPTIETDLTEIYPVVSEIKFVIQHLKSWTKKQKVKTPMALIGSSSHYTYEPKGVCLIISPWNFPLNLTFGPLIWAIAAGNTAIIKPSELTPNTAKVMETIIANLFAKNEIALVQGGIEESTALLSLPFNHIFFTGSPNVGKIVMAAAAKHLTSVTLELGGKSPTIIDETARIKTAAKRIVWGKFLNAGQICITPDYVFVHNTIKDKFINACKEQIELFYSKHPQVSTAYGRIVNKKHYKRLVNHIEDAKTKQAVIEFGGNYNETDNYVAPTIISNLPDNASLMQEEIFGPILPIISYSNIDDVLSKINSAEKPLALYIYSKSGSKIEYILKNTRAGTSAINNNVLQYSNHYLPFGGSNNSGIGKAHGFFGFQEFSNKRAVLKQHTKGAMESLFPPYTKAKQKLVDLTIKWF